MAARGLGTRTGVGASSAVPWRVPRPHGDGAAAGARAGAPGLAQARRGGGGMAATPLLRPRDAPAGQVSRPVPACPVHAIAVTKRARA